MASAASSAVKWYALAVHARQEKAAAEDLSHRGFEIFLPVRRERRAWSARVQIVELVLFPGYLFVHTELSATTRIELLKPRQAIDVVGRLPEDPSRARSIPPHEIDSLMRVVGSERDLDPVARLVEGDSVMVARGPLRGVHGIVERGADGQRRLVVQVELLGRGVRVTLSGEDVIEEVTR